MIAPRVALAQSSDCLRGAASIDHTSAWNFTATSNTLLASVSNTDKRTPVQAQVLQAQAQGQMQAMQALLASPAGSRCSRGSRGSRGSGKGSGKGRGFDLPFPPDNKDKQQLQEQQQQWQEEQEQEETSSLSSHSETHRHGHGTHAHPLRRTGSAAAAAVAGASNHKKRKTLHYYKLRCKALQKENAQLKAVSASFLTAIQILTGSGTTAYISPVSGTGTDSTGAGTGPGVGQKKVLPRKLSAKFSFLSATKRSSDSSVSLSVSSSEGSASLHSHRSRDKRGVGSEEEEGSVDSASSGDTADNNIYKSYHHKYKAVIPAPIGATAEGAAGATAGGTGAGGGGGDIETGPISGTGTGAGTASGTAGIGSGTSGGGINIGPGTGVGPGPGSGTHPPPPPKLTLTPPAQLLSSAPPIPTEEVHDASIPRNKYSGPYKDFLQQVLEPLSEPVGSNPTTKSPTTPGAYSCILQPALTTLHHRIASDTYSTTDAERTVLMDLWLLLSVGCKAASSVAGGQEMLRDLACLVAARTVEEVEEAGGSIG